MQELRFVAVHEDGEHLVLSDPGDDRGEGGEYLLAVDERLRAALRQRATGTSVRPETPISPRAVQALIRAGHSTEEIAGATGWDPARVARFEDPILAEREHVAGRARAAHVRGRATDGGIATLDSRVAERLQARGVGPEDVSWDATRPEGGQWTVVVSFVAANRSRQAAWRYEAAGATVEALDDEARWLSEDEQALPGGRDAVLGGDGAGAVDLVATMRERTRARGRRPRKAASDQSAATAQDGDAGVDAATEAATGAASADPTALPGDAAPSEDVLPLEDLAYDPATAGLPPAAGRPEAAAHAEDPEGRSDTDGADDEEPGADGSSADGSSADESDGEESSPGPAERLLGRRGRRRRNRKAEEATLADFFGPADEDVPAEEADGAGSEAAEPQSDASQATPTPAEDGPGEGGPVEEELDEDAVLLDDSGDGGDADGADDPDGADPAFVKSDAPGADADDPADGEVELADAHELTDEVEPVDEPAALDDVAPLPEEPSAPQVATPTTADATVNTDVTDPEASPGETAPDDAPGDSAATDETAADSAATEPAPEAPSRKKGRKSVPSWDEIMFGAQDRR